MSPHAVNSLVTDLVQMAQAMEKVPQLEHELEIANGRIVTLQESLTIRDDDIAQAKAYASTLEQKVHDLEVAKDAAETMFLEADDRTTRALEFVKTMFGSAGSLIQALEPPRPQPEPIVSEPQPIETATAMHEALSEAFADSPALVGDESPKPDWYTPPGSETLHPDDPAFTGVRVDIPPQGQSAADPTPLSMPDAPMETTQSLSVDSTTVSGSETATSPSWASPTPPNTKPQPYLGKNYYEWPDYVDYADWLAGGGTHDDYWQRRKSYHGEA